MLVAVRQWLVRRPLLFAVIVVLMAGGAVVVAAHGPVDVSPVAHGHADHESAGCAIGAAICALVVVLTLVVVSPPRHRWLVLVAQQPRGPTLRCVVLRRRSVREGPPTLSLLARFQT
jgi:hypothetical protein